MVQFSGVLVAILTGASKAGLADPEGNILRTARGTQHRRRRMSQCWATEWHKNPS